MIDAEDIIMTIAYLIVGIIIFVTVKTVVIHLI
jgi:hypothetical protein